MCKLTELSTFHRNKKVQNRDAFLMEMSFASATLAIREPHKLNLHFGELRPQNRLRLACALYSWQSHEAEVRTMILRQKERPKPNKFDLGFSWRRIRDSHPKGALLSLPHRASLVEPRLRSATTATPFSSLHPSPKALGNVPLKPCVPRFKQSENLILSQQKGTPNRCPFLLAEKVR